MNNYPKLLSVNIESYTSLTNKLSILYLWFVITLLGGCLMSNDINQLNGHDKANALVENFGKYVGIDDATLDENNDRSFGEFGFHYHLEKELLVGRVFIAKMYLNTLTPKETENVYLVMKTLNDPKQGGMFENGGGYFLLEKEMIFLVKEFPLTTITPQKLRKDMDNLINLGATWSMRWFSRVAGIAHGWESVPTEPVTRESENH